MIANPVILLGWIANPAQREQQGATEHPPRRIQLINTPIPPHIVNAIVGDQTIK